MYEKKKIQEIEFDHLESFSCSSNCWCKRK